MRYGALAAAVALVAACASADIDDTLARVNREGATLTAGQLNMARNANDDATRQVATEALLSAPLGRDEAVRLAMMNSPALQALLASGWADHAAAAAGGRLPNPVFSFERVHVGQEVEYGRLLSFGLLDLLTYPVRRKGAERQIEHRRLRLIEDVVEHLTQVRQAWVNAVATAQLHRYAKQVFNSASASAELARRMESVGNFNKITRARQQAFYADAASRLAAAQHEALAAREALVRLTGLTDEQAAKLQLPARLPDLPKTPVSPEDAGKRASRARLDIALARSNYQAAAQAQGLDTAFSFTDIELGVRRDTHIDHADGAKSAPRGFEVDVRLPVFDWGGARRDAMNARTLAAANQLEATTRAAGSWVRESYSAYRTAHDIARHYRDEIIPLRKAISEESLLRYNGMLIGVFELLADSREQVGAVMAAIEAERQFWLAEAALEAALLGKPLGVALSRPASAAPSAASPH